MSLDAWKARNVFEADLESGVHVKGHYMDMETALMGGGFDFTILQGLGEKAASDTPTDADPKEVTEGLRYKRFVVCSCLDEVDGEVVTLTDDDYALLPEADRTQFFNLAIRAEAAADAPLEAAV